jgi:hypothetical protein
MRAIPDFSACRFQFLDQRLISTININSNDNI